MKSGMRIDKYVPGAIIKSRETGKTYLILKELELIVRVELSLVTNQDYRSWLGRLSVYSLEERKNTWLMAESYTADTVEHVLGVKLDAEFDVLKDAS